MAIVNIYDTELWEWLTNFPNKSDVVREALREYKARHYDGVYFSEEEAIRDKKKYEKQLTEAKEKLEKINKLLKEKEREDGN